MIDNDSFDHDDPAAPPHQCRSLEYVLEEANYLLAYDDKFREYVLSESGDSRAEVVLNCCPFCGARLPTSVRAQWHDYFESRDLDPSSAAVPPDMQSGWWWRKAGL